MYENGKIRRFDFGMLHTFCEWTRLIIVQRATQPQMVLFSLYGKWEWLDTSMFTDRHVTRRLAQIDIKLHGFLSRNLATARFTCQQRES
jgi:hypothetical protein